MPTTIVSALKKATKGLTYQSETDAPFEAFLWKQPGEDITRKQVLQLAGKEKARPVKELSLDEFFQDLTADQDWHGKEEKAAVKKYRNLEKVLRAELADVKVFKVGAPQVDIYLVGKTKQGDWAGVRTSAVET
jgi:protoporphyrinogen oxidase